MVIFIPSFFLLFQYLQGVKALTVKPHWVNTGVTYNKARADGPTTTSPPSCCHTTNGMGSFKCCLKEHVVLRTSSSTKAGKKKGTRKCIVCFVIVILLSGKLNTNKYTNVSLKTGTDHLKCSYVHYTPAQVEPLNKTVTLVNTCINVPNVNIFPSS